MENQDSNPGQPAINIQIPVTEYIASRRSLIPGSFTVAIILFFFMFCEFKCGDQTVQTATGINLVVGKELKERNTRTGEERTTGKIPPNPWAVLSLGAAFIGLLAFLIKAESEALIGTITAAVGFASLLVLQFDLTDSTIRGTQGQIDTVFLFPYWLALIALGIAGIVSYLRRQSIRAVKT